MNGRKKITSMVAVLTVVSMVTIGVGLAVVYESAFEQQRVRLIDTVKSQASLTEAVARNNLKAASHIVDEIPEYDAFEATLAQLREAQRVLEAQKLGAGAFVKKPITKQLLGEAARTELSKDRQPA